MKILNNQGKEAVHFWNETNEINVRSCKHDFYKTQNIINEYLSSKGLTANVQIGTNPKNKNQSLMVYSGLDADFDFEGHVDLKQTNEVDYLVQTLNMLGMKCYE